MLANSVSERNEDHPFASIADYHYRIIEIQFKSPSEEPSTSVYTAIAQESSSYGCGHWAHYGVSHQVSALSVYETSSFARYYARCRIK